MQVITFLTFLSLSQPLIFPGKVNITSRQIRNGPACRQARCLVNWVQREDGNLTESQCDQLDHNAESMVREVLADRIDPNLIKVYYGRVVAKFCRDACTPSSAAEIFWLNLQMQLQVAKRFASGSYDTITDQSTLLVKGWPVDYMIWWGRSMHFRVYFASFALPATILINWINLCTISKLIGAHKRPAASLYFHKAEIYTDLIVNIVFLLYSNLRLGFAIVHWAHGCLPTVAKYVHAHIFMRALGSFLVFVNQRTLLNLISDRLSAMRDPLSYASNDGRTIARKCQLRTVASSFLLYIPLFCFYSFTPLLTFWEGQSVWWADYHPWIVSALTTIYALAPLVCVFGQVKRGLQYQKLYEAQLKTTTTMSSLSVDGRQQLAVAKRDEKEKRSLLGGTACLNLVVTLEYMIFIVLDSVAVQRLFGLLWWVEIFKAIDSVFMFLNGTGSFLIHLVLLKPYRKAFWQTPFGKIISLIYSKISSP